MRLKNMRLLWILESVKSTATGWPWKNNVISSLFNGRVALRSLERTRGGGGRRIEHSTRAKNVRRIFERRQHVTFIESQQWQWRAKKSKDQPAWTVSSFRTIGPVSHRRRFPGCHSMTMTYHLSFEVILLFFPGWIWWFPSGKYWNIWGNLLVEGHWRYFLTRYRFFLFEN